MKSVARSVGVQLSSLLSFIPEYKAVLDQMVIHPSSPEKKAYNTYLKGLKDDGILAKMDVLTLYNQGVSTNSEALINWANPTTLKSELKTAGTGVPTFNANKGFLGNKTNRAYITTNYNPAINGINYQLNSASIGFYMRRVCLDTGNITMGSVFGKAMIAPKLNGNELANGAFSGSINNEEYTTTTTTTRIYPGFYAVSRGAAGSFRRYRHNVPELINLNSSVIPNAVIDVLRCYPYYDSSLLSMSWVGADLTDQDMTNMVERFEQLRHDLGEKTIMILGDSTSAQHAGGLNALSQIMTDDNRLLIDVSLSGDTIAQQKTKLNLISANFVKYVDCAFVMLGLNNLQSMSTAQMVVAYQDLIDTIRTKIGNDKKIIGVTQIPCNRSGYEGWNGLNEAIRGNSGTSIAGMDGFIETANTVLNNGSNGLAAMYDSGDGLHENNLGRELIKGWYEAKLTELGM